MVRKELLEELINSGNEQKKHPCCQNEIRIMMLYVR